MLHLKDGMGLRIKKILILWGFIEKSDFGEGVMKYQYIGRNCLKRDLGQLADLRRGLGKKR